MLPLYRNETLILTDKDGCQLNSQYPWQCDLTLIKESNIVSCSNQELLHLSQLFRGDVMEGWYLKNCGEFNDLILMDRMLCERRQVELLRTLSRRYQEEGSHQLCLDTLHKVTAVEPDNEEVALAIMETYIQLGDRAGAIRYYKQFEGILWNDLNISPNNALQAFYHRLKNDYQVQRPDTPQEHCAQDIILKVHCIPQIQGSLLAELLIALLEQVGRDIILGLELPYLQDLRYLSSELAVAYQKQTGTPLNQENSHVPDIRIINAFCALVGYLCSNGTRHLRVSPQEQADELSAAALIKAAQSGNLTIEHPANR